MEPTELPTPPYLMLPSEAFALGGLIERRAAIDREINAVGDKAAKRLGLPQGTRLTINPEAGTYTIGG